MAKKKKSTTKKKEDNKKALTDLEKFTLKQVIAYYLANNHPVHDVYNRLEKIFEKIS